MPPLTASPWAYLLFGRLLELAPDLLIVGFLSRRQIQIHVAQLPRRFGLILKSVFNFILVLESMRHSSENLKYFRNFVLEIFECSNIIRVCQIAVLPD